MAEPTSSNYPTSLDSDVTLGGDQVNFTSLNLDAGIDASTTTVSVAEDISAINVPVYLLCGTELMYAKNKSGGNFTDVDRNAGGTSASAHSNGDDVFVVYAANLFNQLKRAIVATQTELGVAPSGSAATVVDRLDALDAATILKSLGTTKGDMIVFTGSATPVRQGVGAVNSLLRADSSVTNGIAWSADDGWTPDTVNTWSYSSADSPTFVISVNADMTGIIGVGYRIKLTQTTAKYFIVTAVGAFGGGATLITVYGGTDYTLANAAITAPFFSGVRYPFGFPSDPLKWRVKVEDTSDRTEATPTASTWYNTGSLTISVPIGKWRVSWEAALQCVKTVAAAENLGFRGTLSTANNSESDSYFTASYTFPAPILTAATGRATVHKEKELTVAAKTSYYLNIFTGATGTTNIGLMGATLPTTIYVDCAYL